ncbi:O-linked N-acetylglucosamine transferase, SPINDLY family protein [Radicibacter daui]|uniref:O-linked N-acetylglucosamine transferase, SPINDLY family protein n=1 Tax=Radicibacter daui TaxID=3064829 RepID=UPI004046F7E7
MAASLIDLLTRGVAAHQAGERQQALALYREALVLDPHQSETLHLLGVVLGELGQGTEGLERIGAAIALKDHPNYRINRGNLLLKLGQAEAALADYEQALVLAPAARPAGAGKASALIALGREAEAEALLRAMLANGPATPELIFNLALCRLQQGDGEQAAGLFAHCLEARADWPEARLNLATALKLAGRKAEALATLAAAPMQGAVLAMALGLAAELGRHDLVARFRQSVEADGAAFAANQTSWQVLASMAYLVPYVGLSPATEAALHQRANGLLAASPATPAPIRMRGHKLRVGYVSPHFGDHPIAHTVVGLIEAQGAAGEAESFLYATKNRSQDLSGHWQRLQASAGHFNVLDGVSHNDLAARLRTDSLDVLIDLTGYMDGSVLPAFAARPAAKQLYWLGHGGGLGLDFMDGVIGDAIVAPPEETGAIREAVWRLPHYHPADRALVAATVGSRADHGLPEGAFVFCAFNNLMKIDAQAIEIWSKVMSAVPGSVLWLSSTAPEATRFLQATFAACGVTAERVIFAPRLADKSAHLARHAHADLMLDSFSYSASTTAIDALWAGLPMLTRTGPRWASRIGASMVTAAGLGEALVVADEAAYIERAIILAAAPEELKSLRQRLMGGRETAPLWDVHKFSNNFQKLLEAIVNG